MSRLVLVLTRLVVLAVTFAAILGPSFNPADQKVLAANNPVELVVENLNGSQFVYVVFHALDRDGFCNPPAGAVSLHPVLGIPVDFVIEAGDGVIIQNSGGASELRPQRNRRDGLLHGRERGFGQPDPFLRAACAGHHG